MATLTKTDDLGVDVAKDWLDLYDGQCLVRIDNSDQSINDYVKSLNRPHSIAIEATNRYHELFIQYALAAGHTVYVLDAYRVSRYRDAVGVRAKTDANDAALLYRYLQSERPLLKSYTPKPEAISQLSGLLRARSKLAKTRSSMGLYLSDVPGLGRTRQALLVRLERAIALIGKKIERCLVKAGYQKDFLRCQTIPGVGPVNAAALIAIYHRGQFSKVDAFIAFMGLDVRVRESGRYRGQRKLTKKGNPEIRRLLFNAARAGARTASWNPYYSSLRDRGLSTTAACVAIARKIAKVAFALLRDQTEYRLGTTV